MKVWRVEGEFTHEKMASDSEASLSPDSMETSDDSEDSGQEWGVLESKLIPYGDEPLADSDDDRNSDSDDEEADADGLTPAVLEARFERTVSVDSW